MSATIIMGGCGKLLISIIKDIAEFERLLIQFKIFDSNIDLEKLEKKAKEISKKTILSPIEILRQEFILMQREKGGGSGKNI